MQKDWQNSVFWRQKRRTQAALAHLLRSPSLFVALTITFFVEVGQPDPLYWSLLILLTILVSLFLVITLISEITITIIDTVAAWQRTSQSPSGKEQQASQNRIFQQGPASSPTLGNERKNCSHVRIKNESS